MKISIFKKSYSLGIDYSSRKDCLGAFEISEKDIEKLKFGAIPKIVKNKLVIEETEECKKEKIKLIKEKYQKIIFDKYSLTDQLNLSNEALFISSTAQAEKRDFTEEELEKLREVAEAKLWIDSQKKLCGKEILELNN